jgi:hypothetical protein
MAVSNFQASQNATKLLEVCQRVTGRPAREAGPARATIGVVRFWPNRPSRAPEKQLEFGILPIQFPWFFCRQWLKKRQISRNLAKRATSEVVGYDWLLAMSAN